MKRPLVSRLAMALCLLAVTTIAAECSEEELEQGIEIAEEVMGIDEEEGESITESMVEPPADSSDETELESPEESQQEVPVEPTEKVTGEEPDEPEPMEVGCADEINDVMDVNGNSVSSWSPGLDINDILVWYDSEVEKLYFDLSTDAQTVEDINNPYYAAWIGIDANPEGTASIAGRGVFGAGTAWVACYHPVGEDPDNAVLCEHWTLEGSDFMLQDEYPGTFQDGHIVTWITQTYDPYGIRVGFSTQNELHQDTYGVNMETFQIEPACILPDEPMD